MGERYIQIWAPDNGRVPFPNIITVWGKVKKSKPDSSS